MEKKSSRTVNSCVECSRRKTRCDKGQPCSNCVRRGKSHLCRLPTPRDIFKELSVDREHATSGLETLGVEELATAALTELDTLRSTVEGARAQISGLEDLIMKAFERMRETQAQTPPPPPPPPPAPPAGTLQCSCGGRLAEDSQAAPPQPRPPQNRTMVSQGSSASPAQPLRSEPADGNDADLELREQEVAASLSLEFLALGRNRAFAGTSVSTLAPREYPQPDITASILQGDMPSHLNPGAMFPTIDHISNVVPSFEVCQKILDHSMDWIGWYHGAVHAPSFRAELQEFWASGEDRCSLVNPAWLSLFFAQLACGLKHMDTAHLEQLGDDGGLTEEQGKALAQTHFDASLACLFQANFLERHQFYSVQSILILVRTGQDASASNLFSTLLTLGISIAQDLGMHRLPSDEVWAASVAGLSQEARTKSLIDREMKKRVFWSLSTQDWYQLPFRRTTTVLPSQVTTPLPLNASDEDLSRGFVVHRPLSTEYTVVSNVILRVHSASIIQQVFAHLDDNPSPSYAYILELDAKMQAMVDNPPEWMRPDGPSHALPPNYVWMRNSFAISSNHKLLTIHRSFILRYQPSRAKALDASRKILRAGVNAADSRMWTVPYHITAAASIVCLDLFGRSSLPSILDEERHEVQAALSTLQGMESFSSIAGRGVVLISSLLAEEERLHGNTSAQTHVPLNLLVPPPNGSGGAVASTASGAGANKRRRSSNDDPMSDGDESDFVAARLQSLTAHNGGPRCLHSQTPENGPISPVELLSHFSATAAHTPAGGYLDAAVEATPTPKASDGYEKSFTEEFPTFLQVFVDIGYNPTEAGLRTMPTDYSWVQDDIYAYP